MSIIAREPAWDQFFPSRYRTPEEQRDFDALLEAKKPGFVQAIGDAINSEWISSWALRGLNRNTEFDPDFAPDIETLGAGISPDLWPEFADAANADDAMRIRENLLSVAESRERLAALGTRGVALQIGANILDPSFLIAGAVTGGVGAATLKAGRLSNFVRAGMVATAANAPLDIYRATQDPDFGPEDVLFSAAGSMVLGGAVGLWQRSGLSKAATRLQRSIDLENVQRSGGTVLPGAGEAYFDGIKPAATKVEFDDDPMLADILLGKMENLGPTSAQNATFRVDQEIAAGQAATRGLPSEPKPTGTPPAGSTMPQDASGTSASKGPAGSVGAATPGGIVAEPPKGPREPGGFSLEATDLTNLTPRSTAGPLRLDMAGRLGQSDNDMTRFIAQGIVEDPLRKADGRPQAQSALEWANRTVRSQAAQVYKQYGPAWEKYAKSKGIHALNVVKNVIKRDEFAVSVTRAIRSGEEIADPHMAGAVKAAQAFFRKVGQIGKDYGIKGFDGFELRDSYIPRVMSQAGIAKANAAYGNSEVIAALRGAIAKENPDFSNRLLDKWADGYYRIVNSLRYGNELDKSIRLGDPDVLREMLTETGALSKADIDEIVESVSAPAVKEQGKIARAKQRTLLDEGYVHTTKDGRQFRIDDLFENNIESLMHLYARQVIGEAGLSEVMRAVGRSTNSTIETPASLLNKVRQWAIDNNSNPAATDRDIAKLDVLIKSLRGQSLGEHGLWYQVGRTVRGLNFLSRSGTFGVAQLPDIGQIIAHTGFTTTLNNVPTLAKVLKQAATGKMDDELIDWIESVLGHGTDPLTNQVLSRFDDSGAFVQVAAGRFQEGLSHAQRFAANYSLMTPVNMVLQKWAALGAIQKWVRYADSGKLPSVERLRAMGLEPAMGQRIIKAMREEGAIDTVPGLVGRKAKRINLEAWKDQEAASAWVVALDRWSRQMVIQPSIGDFSKWMTSDIGRIIMQFRGFAAASWTRLLLAGIQNARHGDVAAAIGTFIGMGIGGLSYAAQVYTNSIGRKDAEEYRKKRLGIKNISKAAFQRGGASSLIPIVLNEATNLAHTDQPFNYRNSGLESDPIFGNPTFDVITSRGKGFAGLFRAPIDSDYDFSQENLRALRTFLPFQNALGVKKVLDSIGSRLPTRSTDE